MKCSFQSRRAHQSTSLGACLKKKGLELLSQDKMRQCIDSLTASTQNRYLSWIKYFHAQYAYCLARIYLLLLITALLAISFTLYNFWKWWPTPSFENVTSFGLVCLTMIMLSIGITGFRDYLSGRSLIRRWLHTRWSSIDNWKKIVNETGETFPQEVCYYLEKLADANSELRIRLQYTQKDGTNNAGTFIIINDSRTSKTYFARFWH